MTSALRTETPLQCWMRSAVCLWAEKSKGRRIFSNPACTSGSQSVGKTSCNDYATLPQTRIVLT
ncbi:hypothetical protein BS47DRAFT_1337408 [Hydnum rufescens UP504]|uniref:Uncharacterized protein n=1 Tax=Hydnum rufescens UP504 TaxID=1448309 RepID=A0A9P6B925_9AGAM|nr:hypothetical protein BS47DRAFT_1337408 [Hydnum rufescens UP504]